MHCCPLFRCGLAALALTAALGPSSSTRAQTATASQAVAPLDQTLPAAAGDFTSQRSQQVVQAAARVEAAAAELAEFRGLRRAEQFVDRVDDLLSIKHQVDIAIARCFALRSEMAALDESERRRDLLRNYLRVNSALVDLSGRLRYLLYDALYEAAYQASPRPPVRERLIDMLLAYRSSIGAAVMIEALFDPPSDAPSRAQPAGSATKLKLLRLAAVARQVDLLPVLAEFATEDQTPPELVVAAVDTIRQVGLPQDPRPGQDSTLPRPALTARDLAALLARINPAQLAAASRNQRAELLDWLKARVENGLDGEGYRLGNADVRPGDWLLMRNPSPYNHFTDLAPGLFTHVGVITSETGADGKRRMVLVDLPERGKEMQATNLDVFVQRTLHYIVLRHSDPEAGQVMGDVARRVIGNPTQFDLTFRTARVELLRGKELSGAPIHTYCAGLLLLCAQETAAPRSEFFPIAEYPAGGQTVENLARLGITFGDNFISPTGALFSPRLQLVGYRESMYDPGREIEQGIFDHFATRLSDRTLIPSPDLFQSVRLKLADMSKQNPILAKALAEAAGVSENLDLVSAAKAAAVVETLDEVAESGSLAFRHARDSITAGPFEGLRDAGYTPEELAAIAAYRKRHQQLHLAWEAESLSPRALRIQLVDYYLAKGRRQLDERFFSAGTAAGE